MSGLSASVNVPDVKKISEEEKEKLFSSNPYSYSPDEHKIFSKSDDGSLIEEKRETNQEEILPFSYTKNPMMDYFALVYLLSDENFLDKLRSSERGISPGGVSYEKKFYSFINKRIGAFFLKDFESTKESISLICFVLCLAYFFQFFLLSMVVMVFYEKWSIVTAILPLFLCSYLLKSCIKELKKEKKVENSWFNCNKNGNFLSFTKEVKSEFNLKPNDYVPLTDNINNDLLFYNFIGLSYFSDIKRYQVKKVVSEICVLFHFILNEMKNKKGKINLSKMDYFEKITKSLQRAEDLQMFLNSKDNNGKSNEMNESNWKIFHEIVSDFRDSLNYVFDKRFSDVSANSHNNAISLLKLLFSDKTPFTEFSFPSLKNGATEGIEAEKEMEKFLKFQKDYLK